MHSSVPPRRSTDRGTVPVVAVVLLLVVSVAGATTLTAVADQPGDLGWTRATPLASSAPGVAPVSLSISFSVDGRRLTVVNHGGGSLHVRRLSLTVSVDGTPLRHQPPVPFFAARGFRPGPTGAFNVGSDGRLSPGERASVRLAGTNGPLPSRGSQVRVVVRVGDRAVASLRAVAR